ncbi:MAG TPA: helix-turn-helix transcriptional regulator [Rhodanobacteraceae bacterium]|nr:helix-turn-helix transcriptional regulator [Rhodanobacteraceae bacterium]
MNANFSRSGKNKANTPDIAVIAEAVRNARKRNGITQTELAGLSGTGLRFISELERGKPNVALNKVVAVLAALGLRLEVHGDGA